MKACPACAELIQDEAKVCRFCGYKFPTFFSPGGRPADSKGGCGVTLAVVAAVLILANLFSRDDQTPPATPQSDYNPATSPARFKRLIGPHLKDPASAEISIVSPACALVNARNGFGGMTGNQRVIVYADDRVLLEEANPRLIRSEWAKYC